MVSSKIYIEGGGESKELKIRCREAFCRLFEKSGLARRMPRLVACGGRTSTFDSFSTAHVNAVNDEFIAMLVDSEEPVADIQQPWNHLRDRDGWGKPPGATDEQVLLMTTCMESWIVADRETLRRHYSNCLQENSLPDLADLESKSRHQVQDSLTKATRMCKNRYSKGQRSFEVVAKLDPAPLRAHLPSFERCLDVLLERLK